MLDIKVRYSRKALADPATMDRLADVMAFAQALVARLQVRVRDSANPAAPVPPYSSRRSRSRPYRISSRYADAAGVKGTKWRNSAAFHAAARAKSGAANVTGGMWQGVRARNFGESSAILDFGGSSLGGDATFGKTKGGRDRKQAPKIRNSLKAAAVLRSQRVHLLEPTGDENAAMGSALARWMTDRVNVVLGGALLLDVREGDHAMYREALRRLARSGGAR